MNTVTRYGLAAVAGAFAVIVNLGTFEISSAIPGTTITVTIPVLQIAERPLGLTNGGDSTRDASAAYKETAQDTATPSFWGADNLFPPPFIIKRAAFPAT